MDEDRGHKYDVVTLWEKLVADYTGLNMLEVEDLDCIDYLQFRRDAFIYSYSKTEAGQEYLENAYRLEQTKPDREGLRRLKKGGLNNG